MSSIINFIEILLLDVNFWIVSGIVIFCGVGLLSYCFFSNSIFWKYVDLLWISAALISVIPIYLSYNKLLQKNHYLQVRADIISVKNEVLELTDEAETKLNCPPSLEDTTDVNCRYFHFITTMISHYSKIFTEFSNKRADFYTDELQNQNSFTTVYGNKSDNKPKHDQFLDVYHNELELLIKKYNNLISLENESKVNIKKLPINLDNLTPLAYFMFIVVCYLRIGKSFADLSCARKRKASAINKQL